MIELLLRFGKPLAGIAVVIAIALFIRGYGDRRFAEGVSSQQTADTMAAAVLRKKVGELTAANLRLAAQAHETYEIEHAQNLHSASMPVGTRELCKPADSYDSRGDVPGAGTAKRGDAAEPATAGVVQQVPAPDNGRAVDRRRLLGALAGLADDDSGVIREFQVRDIPP